jgi:hypothetical protein
MSDFEQTHHYGPPAIELAGLRVWVHGYQFPESNDAWDGNWLRVTASCVASGARVIVTGAILDTVSFLRFGRELAAVYERLQGEATLESLEPGIKVEAHALGVSGGIEVRVEISPDPLNQAHRFVLLCDQSYLPAVIRGCEEVLARFPVRNAAARGI